MTPEETARTIAEYASDRKALDIVQLDLRGIIGYTDYFVVCTGRTDRQTKAIHDAIHAGMKSEYAILPLWGRSCCTLAGTSEVSSAIRGSTTTSLIPSQVASDRIKSRLY